MGRYLSYLTIGQVFENFTNVALTEEQKEMLN
jgi:hypothetical protein